MQASKAITPFKEITFTWNISWSEFVPIEGAGFHVLTTMKFSDAMLLMMNHRPDVFVMCQTLRDDERHGILETARALQADTKCVVIKGNNPYIDTSAIEDAVVVEGSEHPDSFLATIDNLLERQTDLRGSNLAT